MATNRRNVRLPYSLPSHREAIPLPDEFRLIWFRHPGYPDDRNTLFSFTASDNDGVHHETARLACAVVAGNRWDGFLCEDKNGRQRFMGGPDEILEASDYYFHLPGASNDNYAITPTFYHWKFPHRDLPKIWQTIKSSRPEEPFRRCRMTLNKESVENAHLVPVAQQPWFDVNDMVQYISSPGIDNMNSIKNTIRLRRDIHTIFDAKRFTIVPKEGLLVAHACKEDDGSEVIKLYHNVPLQQLEAKVQFLFARFAYTVFEQLRKSLQSCHPWKLRLRVGEEMEERECTGAECREVTREITSESKSRGGGSRKRQNTQNIDDLALDESEATDEEDQRCSEMTDEEDQRGRKRRRTGESWWSPMSYVSTNFTERELTVSVAGARQVVA